MLPKKYHKRRIKYSNDWSQLPNVVLDHVFSYLSWSDKVKASSTCKRWRTGLYHPRYWETVSFPLSELNDKNKEKARYFIQAFGKIVKYANIYFNSTDFKSYSVTDELLYALRDNMRLKKLMLIPTHCALFPINGPCNSSATLNASWLYYHILSILRNTDKFEELSIGCLNDVAMYSNKLLKIIADYHSKSIRALGFATLKCDPDEHILDSLNYGYIQNFTNLQVLSVNYDYVDDQFLQILCNCMSLKRIVIHIHSNIKIHPGTSEEAWRQLTKYCPKLELRLNVIHAYYAVLDLHTSILKKSMPLTHLRVFFCEKLNSEALNSLHMYQNSLKSLWWVDAPIYSSDCNVLLKLNDPSNGVRMNPFIFVAWRCTNLEELVLFGYNYFADDLCAISRLRGPVLKQVSVLRSEMHESTDEWSYHQTSSKEIQEEMSRRMGRPWKPLKKCELHPVFFSPEKYDSAEYLLPILCKDIE